MTSSSPPAPILRTSRLLMRLPTAADLPAYHGLRGDPQVMKFSPTHQPDVDEAATWEKLGGLLEWNGLGESLVMVVELLRQDGTGDGKGKMVGDMGITDVDHVEGEDREGKWEAEIGYMLLPSLWGKGLMSEALGAFTQWFWDLDLSQTVSWKLGKADVLKAIVEEENYGSLAVLKKCGFMERRRWINEGEIGKGDRLVEMVLHRPA